MISDIQLAKLRDLIDCGKQDNFYALACWKKLAEQVKRLDNYECQHCKAAGHYSPGEIVHHVKHLVDAPELSLSIWDPATGERQLVTLCRECHRREHPEQLRYAIPTPPLTDERWD